MNKRNSLANSKIYQNKAIIQMPELIGDTQIWVGQAVCMLIRLAFENNLEYSDNLKHSFKVELMDSILKELEVMPEEIIKLREDEKDTGF